MHSVLALVLAVFQATALAIQSIPIAPDELRSCEPMNVSLCSALNYRWTYLPNLKGHQTQEEASNELADFAPLLETNCSPYLLHFLCAYYVPLCKSDMPLNLEVPPCRELCSHVYKHCYQYFVAHQLNWPEHLHCSLFPTKSEMRWCFGPDNPDQLSDSTSTSISPSVAQDTTSTELNLQPTPSTEEISSLNTANKMSTSSVMSTPIQQSSQSSTPSLTPSVSPVLCQMIPNNSFCYDIGYNMTGFPNSQGHKSREEAEYELRKFGSFVLLNCSPKILQYLCYFYLPQCVMESTPPYTILQPCKESCQEVQNDCKKGLSYYNMAWPNYMDCELLPSMNEGDHCSTVQSIKEDKTTPTVVYKNIPTHDETSSVVIHTASFIFLILLLSLYFIITI